MMDNIKMDLKKVCEGLDWTNSCGSLLWT